MPTNASSPEATPRLRRELVWFNWLLRAGVLAVVVLFIAAFAGAAPASAHWRASGSGSTTASAATLLPPTNVSVPASSNSNVAVSWTGSPGAVVPTGYYVTRISGSTAVAACGSSPAAPIAGTTCTDASVPEGTHRYQVTAVHRSWTAAGPVSETVAVTSLRDLSFDSQPSATVAAGSPITVSVRATSAGIPSAGVPVTISLGANPAAGTLSGTVTATTDGWGTAAFGGLSINKAAAGYTLIASSPGYAGAVSSTFTVVPAAASKLTVTSSAALTGPASSAAILGPVTLQRQDAYGNAVTAGISSVSLATSSAGATIFAAAANGAKISTVTIPAGSSSASFFYGDTKAGTATITAASQGLAAPAPVTATITAAAAGRLKFDAIPAVVLKNTPITPPVSVHVLDAFGNPVDNSAQVMLQSNCTIKGTLTRAASSGLAAFPDLEIAGKASGCVLTASSGTLATDTSNPFNAD
ncbi:hypothetical protein M8J71_11995 [Pseudarthrobacter sp. R1]|uniref:carboxypeptidase-like regulatory domain-containing protein n=1 Tax=Pseudarthrobacter sp. R1 TaxID=2944934 RepID=UPI00210959A1|nr:carboxypeptidase-like regulatory domain-containing protein [Pseudarthrobacter sp. R1]MCQ6271202.1 hypothetical protein [Pseudarthrobacter sp. R1]